MLKGRVAIVTGSTTGIGQGIADSLAAAGCAVMLNGFGDAAQIDKQRAEMCRQSERLGNRVPKDKTIRPSC